MDGLAFKPAKECVMKFFCYTLLLAVCTGFGYSLGFSRGTTTEQAIRQHNQAYHARVELP